jgi:DNA-binding response OmpR family regulator
MKTDKEIIKVLHLEDSPDDAFFVSLALAKGKPKMEILVVDTRAAFIQELRRFMPDIILSDHSLPAFNSLEALAIVKYSGLKIPFILVTGSPAEEYVVGVLEEGMDDFILKDRLARLPAAIENALRKYKLEEKLEKLMKEKAAIRLLVYEQ